MPLSALAVPVALWISLAPQDDDARMQWWREARVGIAFHLGLYSTAGGAWDDKPVDGAPEWLQADAAVAAADYAALAPRFDPAQFDARVLVAAAKGAGMKYVAITSKHHEGFALFDSRLTDFDVAATPFRRDVVREMADACAEAGLVFGLHHSILDWHHPDYLASYDRYRHFLEGQLTELLSDYGPIGALWLDGGWDHSAAEHHADEVVELIRRLQPQILLDDGLQLPQDFATPKPALPASGRSEWALASESGDWEERLPLQDRGGWKPTAILVRSLVDVASRGGNTLLHVVLDGAGTIPAEGAERLADLGRWFAANGESIHGTTASPFRRLPFGRCTTRAARLPAPAGKSTLYLHVFDWPKDATLRLPGLRNRTVGARLLADPERVGVLATRDGDDVLVLLPGERLDPVDSVVALTISGPPEVAAAVARPDAQGVVKLTAVDAELQGRTARFDGDPELQCIASWSDPRDFAAWEFELPAAARLDVAVEYACPPESAGSEVVLAVGAPERPGPELRFAIGSSGAWNRFKSARVGTLPMLGAGRWTLTLKAASKAGDAVANLRSLSLSPAR